jgi:dsRNA-specific ribonuclease
MPPPPLPTVQNDTALVIFAHTSVRSPEQDDRAARLAFLGEKVLHMVTAETLLEKKPMLDTAALNVSALHLTSMCISVSCRY